jgi:hypothetical protein
VEGGRDDCFLGVEALMMLEHSFSRMTWQTLIRWFVGLLVMMLVYRLI